MAWFRKPKYSTVKTGPSKAAAPDSPIVKCEECGATHLVKDFEAALRVCSKCGFHHRITARARLGSLIDPDSFTEFDANLHSVNALGFPGYEEKIKKGEEATGLKDSVLSGEATVEGRRVALVITDFFFIGGSMGSVMGEKVTRAIERAIEKRLPVVIVSASGGGARMQEGALSLMQMAKINAALARLDRARLPFISVLTDPTGGGVTASFALLGDVNIAEPKALIAFAGARVIEQTIRQRLPKDFQRSEFLMKKGMVDLVVARKELKATIARVLSYLCAKLPAASTPSPEPAPAAARG